MEAAVGEKVIISGISNNVTKSAAVIACTGLTLLYVAILYFPTLILRLPHPNSYKQFLIRRFICAGVASILSICISSSILLPLRCAEPVRDEIRMNVVSCHLPGSG